MDEVAKQIIQQTMSADHEGGYYEWGPKQGGATKYGITIDTLKRWRGKAVTKEDVKALSTKEAENIYYNMFYKQRRVDEIQHSLKDVYFDIVIQHSWDTSHKIIKRAVNITGFEEYGKDWIPLDESKPVGTETIRWINQMPTYVLRTNMLNVRQAFFMKRATKDQRMREIQESLIKNRVRKLRR